jgi:hypothetical protein
MVEEERDEKHRPVNLASQTKVSRGVILSDGRFFELYLMMKV